MLSLFKFTTALVLSTFIFAFHGASTAAASSAAKPAAQINLVGKWVMHLYLGSRLFDDEVTIVKDQNGALGGTLVVPARFTTTIQNLSVSGRKFQFEITADEGQGPFSVRYEGQFHETEETFVGFATVLGKNSGLLGGFVGARMN